MHVLHMSFLDNARYLRTHNISNNVDLRLNDYFQIKKKKNTNALLLMLFNR